MLAINQKILVAKTSSGAKAQTPRAFKHASTRGTTHVIQWPTGVTSGVVEIETADDPDYAGTWAPVSTVTFAGTAPKEDYVYVPGVYSAFQHRISTVVAGGASPSVTTFVRGEGD